MDLAINNKVYSTPVTHLAMYVRNRGPVTVQKLVREFALGKEQLMARLQLLEKDGVITKVKGNKWTASNNSLRFTNC